MSNAYRFTKILSLAATTLMLLPGCGEPASTATTSENLPGPHVVKSDKVRNTAPVLPAGDLENAVSDNRDFAFALYEQLAAENDGNFFYSPHSISLALAMTYAGARETTATEMASALHFNLPQERLHPAFNAIDLELASRAADAEGRNGKGFALDIANSLWGQDGYPFLSEFLDVLAENYGAGMSLVDFARAAEEARQIINSWVSDHTAGRIPELLPAGSVDGAVLVLTNAIYFNAGWLHPFAEDATYNDTFHLLDGSEVTVPMMAQQEVLNVARADGYTAVELPYDGRDLSMVVVVPEDGRFREIEGAMGSALIEEIVNGLAPESIFFRMPRWSFRSHYSLADVLSSMGMPTAFSLAADFSGMNGFGQLMIPDVIHEAFVSVDEYGTEAAAATAVIMVGTGEIPTIAADRPFIFFIRDLETGTILFVGRVLNPAL